MTTNKEDKVVTEEVEDSPQLYIVGFHKAEDSEEVRIDYQVTEELKTWYKDKNNLKRWHRKHFEYNLVQLVAYEIRRQLEENKKLK